MPGRARFLRLYFAAWIPFAALYSLIVAQQSSPADAILSGLLAVGVAAVLGLGVHVTSRWIRDRAWPRWRFLVAHAGIASVFSAIWTTVISLMIYWGAPESAWRPYYERALWWQFVTGLALYGLVAGVFEAIAAGRRMREQERLAARADAARVRAELAALRAQLNPHMLFNTLHSITALVREDPPAAELALEQFGLLMRRVLDIHREGRDEVPLADELDFIRAFLSLERMRLGDRLRVEEDVDPEALECHVPSFSLQPLVENAIIHGIAPMPRGGTLRITARLGDHTLHLEVADDGAGADPSRLGQDGSVGLGVVRQRLAARFGSAASLEVVTSPGEGCRVRIAMPIVVQPLAVRRTAEFAVPR